jgi:serine/threonine-protein kinase
MRENDLIQDRYRLQHPIGKGGMAEVWRARDERLQRPVAVKFLAAQFHDDPEFLVRFLSEAQSVARLHHSNVVDVLDFGDFEDRPYLVMEYVAGGSLAGVAGEPMLPERAMEIVAEAARGAGAAHAMGLVHRDIKPGNILLTDDGRAKLADFGIASSENSEKMTATGQAIGSPHYISPEQASGVGCAPPSDVYSLGVVLYELLTGRPPFDADNVTAIAIAHVDRAPIPPGELVADLDPALEELVLRCLAKDPAARFDDGSALAAALDNPREAPALFPLHYEIDEELEELPPLRRRLLTGIGVTAAVLGLLAAGVWAAGRTPSEERERSFDQETVDQGTADDGKRNGPKPTPTGTFDSSGAVPVVDEASPSASPTAVKESPEGKKDSEGGSGSTGGGGSAGGGSTGGATPSPQPTEEPSPQPTAEPTSEPSPEPTAQSEGGDQVTQPTG